MYCMTHAPPLGRCRGRSLAERDSCVIDVATSLSATGPAVRAATELPADWTRHDRLIGHELSVVGNGCVARGARRHWQQPQCVL